QKWTGDTFKALHHLVIMVALYRYGKLFNEMGEITQKATVGKIHDTPVFGQPVFNRGARQGNEGRGRNGFNGLGLCRSSMLDVLCFIDDDNAPGEFLELG